MPNAISSFMLTVESCAEMQATPLQTFVFSPHVPKLSCSLLVHGDIKLTISDERPGGGDLCRVWINPALEPQQARFELFRDKLRSQVDCFKGSPLPDGFALIVTFDKSALAGADPPTDTSSILELTTPVACDGGQLRTHAVCSTTRNVPTNIAYVPNCSLEGGSDYGISSSSLGLQIGEAVCPPPLRDD